MTPDELDGALGVIGRLGLTIRQLEERDRQMTALIADKNEQIEQLQAAAPAPGDEGPAAQ